jgi:uncharacterized repeat protein (TIGR03803 family)
VDDGTTYFYRITASPSYGQNSRYSNEASATPTIDDPANPVAGLIQATDGFLYGTTQNGGTYGMGTVYKLDPSVGTTTILHSFSALDSGGNNSDGTNPKGALVQGTDGSLYGTASQGGIGSTDDYGRYGNGTLFKIDTSGNFTSLHSFSPVNDGSQPTCQLAKGADGNFYGTASYGGASQQGTIYSITPTGTFTLLHAFGSTAIAGFNEGSHPFGGLVLGTDGNFHGATYNGGSVIAPTGYDTGTLFSVTTGGQFNVDYTFYGDGGHTYANLLSNSDGWLYGTTVSYPGQIFQASAGISRTVYSFDSSGINGFNPYGGLIKGSDGAFYGTTEAGGTSGKGVVFKLDSSHNLTVLHSFTGYVQGDPGASDGDTPMGTLLQTSDGSLYGTTFYGGSTNSGMIFKLVPGTGGVYTYSGPVRNLNAPPAAPKNVTVTVVSPTSLTISWGAVPGATSYKVERALSQWGPFATIATTTATTYTDTGLTPGVSYYYRITAIIADGEGPPSEIISGTPSSAPAAPLNLVAAAGDTQVSLTWTSLVGATGYNVKRALNSGGPYSTIGSPTGASYIDTGLTNGTTYYYVVTGATTAGETNISNQAEATPTSAGPTNLTATSGNSVANLTWDPVTGATSYNVKVSNTNGGPYYMIKNVTSTSYQDNSVVNGKTYYYVVSALTSNGESSDSNQVKATPNYQPPNVIFLTATPGNAVVTLSWSAANRATTYNVKRSTTSGSGYTVIASPSAGVNNDQTTFVDSTLTNGKTYYYVVSGSNGGGESVNSLEACATPLSPPDVPTGLVASSGNGMVVLNWNASLRGLVYIIERSATAGGPYMPVGSILQDEDYPDSPLTWSDTGDQCASTAGVYDSSPVNGTTYYYVIVASNVGGLSGNSNEAVVTPNLAVPPVPTRLMVDAGDGSASLSWLDSESAIGYNVYRSTSSASRYTQVNAASISQTRFVDNVLADGTHYYYVVTALNASGESGYSNEVNTIPTAPSLSSAAAIQIAKDFCQGISVPITINSVVTAQFPAPKRYLGMEDTFWLPKWLVTFNGVVEVEVVDSLGIVNRFLNIGLVDQLEAEDHPVLSTIDENSARQVGTNVIQSSGISPADLGSTVAYFENFTDPPSSASQSWNLTWRRMYGTTPYLDQQASLTLAPEDGSVIAFSVAFSSQDPSVANMNNTSMEQALQTSENQLTSIGAVDESLNVEQLVVVRPNTFWQPGGTYEPSGAPARVAWDCDFLDGSNNFQIWVDAETGAIIGGTNLTTFSLREGTNRDIDCHARKSTHQKKAKRRITDSHFKKAKDYPSKKHRITVDNRQKRK